jgi:hypothetical protein
MLLVMLEMSLASIKMDETLYILSYILYKIKENGDYIKTKQLKEIIARTINLNGGFPKFMDKYVIEDLIRLRLIERLNYDNYKILNTRYANKCVKTIKKIVSLYY